MHGHGLFKKLNSWLHTYLQCHAAG